jgi:hypothetical protein
MVAFISPRKSKVDIVQATGRAMRRAPGKEIGYVMVPLFVEQAADESIEDALKRTGFDDLWDLLGAMKEQDDVLVDIIRQMQEDKGRTGGYDDSRFSERVEVLGPSVSLETIRRSITAECLEWLGASWDKWFGELLAYVESEQHCLVPQRYLTRNGSHLGRWVSIQRVARNSLPVDRRTRLEMVPGWVWDAIAEQWEIGFRYLVEFAKNEGHGRVPSGFLTIEKYHLGTWVITQRRAKDKMSFDQKRRLESVSGWIWDANEEKWELGFHHLLEFVANEGHSGVHQHFVTSDGFRLGRWLVNQRTAKDNMPATRKKRLESLKGWAWNAFDENWELGFRLLIEFEKLEGHCLVPQKFRTTSGFSLGSWVSNQRVAQEDMPIEQKLRLETIPGWVWDVRAEQWSIGFRHLEKFSSSKGHCQVSLGYETEDGFKLGQWVSTQRRNQNSLSAERRNLLDELPNWMWGRKKESSLRSADQWEAGFRYLKEFVAKEGHCLVPRNYIAIDGYRLGGWVSRQRTAKNDLPDDLKMRLQLLPNWKW